jgi:hypothetical protein
MVENPDPAQGIPKLFGEEIKSFPKVIERLCKYITVTDKSLRNYVTGRHCSNFLTFWGVENYGARLWSTLLTIAVDLDS